MLQRMLVPLDGSPRGERALSVAARITHATAGSLLLVRVVSPPIDYSGGLAPLPMLSEQVIESEMNAATAYLRTVAASPLLAGIRTRTDVLFGLPVHQIIAAAEAYESDLVVLCSHGRSGFTRWALGSVAHGLVHQSALPVVVLRESEPLASLQHVETSRPLCALVPLDGSPLAEAVLSPAAHLTAALAAPAQGALHLVQVVKVEEDGGSELNEEVLQQVRTYLAMVAARLQAAEKDLKLSLTASVELEADVASALLSLAERGSKEKHAGGVGACDLIAISSHGRGGVERWVMGSVTERLLTTSKLPMLIVRPQKKG